MKLLPGNHDILLEWTHPVHINEDELLQKLMGTQPMEFTAKEFDLIIEDQRRFIRRDESLIRSTERGTSKNNVENRQAVIRQRRRLLSKAIKQRARLVELNGNGDDE